MLAFIMQQSIICHPFFFIIYLDASARRTLLLCTALSAYRASTLALRATPAPRGKASVAIPEGTPSRQDTGTVWPGQGTLVTLAGPGHLRASACVRDGVAGGTGTLALGQCQGGQHNARGAGVLTKYAP
jgi:hypothetical protein